MNANVGDRLVISGHHVGEHEREGADPRGAGAARPLLTWSDGWMTGTSACYPGPDARVQHVGRTKTKSP